MDPLDSAPPVRQVWEMINLPSMQIVFETSDGSVRATAPWLNGEWVSGATFYDAYWEVIARRPR